MSDFRRQLKKEMQNPEFAAAYEAQRPEYEYVRAIINARLEQNMTQAELAKRTGIRQSNISRVESGACSPNVATLQEIAKGLGKRLSIEFK